MQGCDIDMNVEIGKNKQSAPYVVITGTPGTENAQYFVTCEQEIFIEAKSMQDCLLDLVATYYVCNIAYPKALSAIMLFIQQTVLNLKDHQLVPPALTKLVNNLNKVTV